MKRLTTVSALALCTMAAPAFADVTPQQVWTDLEAYLEGFGYAIAATEAEAGGVLTLSDLAMTVPLPEEGGNLVVTMGEITLTDLGDGSVGIGYPQTMPIGITTDIEGDAVDMVIDYTNDGLEMVVSGSPGDLTYDYKAAMLGLSLARLVVEGEEITRDMARVLVTMGPVAGTSHYALADGMRTVSQTGGMGDMAIDAAFNEPGGSNNALFNVKLAGISITGESLIPEGIDFSDPAAIFEAGFAFVGGWTHSGGTMDFSVTDNGKLTAGTLTTTSGAANIGMSGDEMTYDIGNTGMVLALQGPDIPLPINVEMAETRLHFALPLQASEEPQDAAIGLTLAGFKTTDMLWNMFDPGAVLPRDPATISVDMTAKVTPFVSLLDEQAMMELDEGAVPGELNAVTLNSLVVEAAGGKITGDGAFTFDNTDLVSFDGMPRPEGKLNLAVSGANGLIDKIIAMGLMSDQDAMGARMMLSMFTVPGTAPDTATSVIEVNAEGQVMANGQRIK